MVGQYSDLEVIVNKALVDGHLYRQKLYLGIQFPEDGREAVELLRVIGTYIGLIAGCLVLVHLPDEQIKILVKRGLRC